MVTIEQAKKDKEMLEKFTEENYGLIVNTVKKYFGYNNPNYEDYIQIASEGFLKSIKYFNQDFGAKFSSYAVPMMLGELKRYRREKEFLLKVPRTYTDIYFKYTYLSAKGEDNQKIADTIEGHENKTTLEEITDTGVDWEEEALSNIALAEKIEKIKRKYGDVYVKVLKLRLENKSQTEIGGIVRKSQAEVSRMLKKVKKIFINEDGKEEIEVVA